MKYMTMYRKWIGFLFCLGCGQLMAQVGNKGVFGSPVMPGPNGVYIYTADSAGHMRRPAAGQTYTVYKEEKKGGGFKKLAELGFPVSAAELEKRLGKPLLDDILKRQKLRAGDDLYAQLRAGHLDTLGIYSNSFPVQEAMGVLYIDKGVKGPTEGVSYRLEVNGGGLGVSGSRLVYQLAIADIPYTPMPVFKKYHTMVTDSVAMVTWYAAGVHVPLKTDQPKAAFATIYSTAGSGGQTTFTGGPRQFAYLRRDTLFVTYSTATIPGSKVLLYMRPEDIAGNRGPVSDTVHLLALSFRNVLSIDNLTALDTLGSVWLKWDSLPAKAWISGIQVLKSRSAGGGYIAIDTLPVTATAYRDRKVISGNVYYYSLRAILFDLPQQGRFTPALVSVRTKKVSSKILAPQGLQLGLTSKSDIRLSWLPNGDLDIFAYYILRGTSRSNMQVISPAIRDTVFVDSLNRLNAGITYLYSVAAMNMDMVWSDTSEPVGIQSPRAKLLMAVGGIQARTSAQGVRLSWNDVAISDPAVTGYMLYRRKKGEQYFVPVTTHAVPGTHYTDSAVLGAGVYEYGCSSVDAWGHVSFLSPLAEVSAGAASALYPPAGFFVRNLPVGIEVSVPATLGGGGRYVIYRRMVTEKQYHKIGEMEDKTYVDKAVLKNELYVYVLGLPGAAVKSGEKSIRRK